jgi:hypothetical protein
MIVYKITVNGKSYIGKTKSCNSNEELQNSEYWGGGVFIERALKKYGKENAIRKVLIHFNKNEYNKHESLWIKKLNTKFPNGYNLTDGEDGVTNPSEESREKNRKSHIGKKHTEETKLKMRRPKSEKGKKNIISGIYKTWKKRKIEHTDKNPKSEKWCKKLSISMKKRYEDYNERLKTSIACKGHLKKESTKLKMRHPKSESHKQNMKKPKPKESIINYINGAKKRKYNKECKECGINFESKCPTKYICNSCRDKISQNNYIKKHIRSKKYVINNIKE